MGLEPGGLRQWWWELGEKVQAKRLFASMYISLVQDLLKDGMLMGQLNIWSQTSLQAYESSHIKRSPMSGVSLLGHQLAILILGSKFFL